MQPNEKLHSVKDGQRPLKPPPTYHEHEDGHGGGAHDESNWLVSYADMMTLLFGFFVLMYSLSKVDLDKFELVSKDIAKHFGGQVVDKSAGFKLKDELKQVVSRAGVTQGVDISSTDNGIVLKFNGSLLFDSGSARLKTDMQPALTEIAKTLQSNRSVNQITVEGHTDDDPIESNIFPTNWELSAARASRVTRHFEAYGFPSANLVAEGYGASRPLSPNRAQDGNPIKENQALNRRVVIRVSFGKEVLDAAKALDSKKFAMPEQIREVGAEEADTGVAPVEILGPEITVEQRLEAAKTRFESAQRKLKEMEKENQKQAKLTDLEKKIQEMDRKAAEAENRMNAINGLPPTNTATTNPPNGELSLQEGLKRIKDSSPREPAKAKDAVKKPARRPSSEKRKRLPTQAGAAAKAAGTARAPQNAKAPKTLPKKSGAATAPAAAPAPAVEGKPKPAASAP